MASAAIRNSQAGPSASRSASISRGITCGSTTLSASCQLEAPSVSALTICSRGSSPTRAARSRVITGAMPTAISVTLAVSPRPSAMNRIGSRASGGTIDTAPRKDDSSARAKGTSPVTVPSTSASRVATARAAAIRSRLAAVSLQNRYSPVRGSATRARRSSARPRDAKLGSSLSVGLAARRRAEASA